MFQKSRKFKCTCTDPFEICKNKQCPWYIREKKYYNCFEVMKYFIDGEVKTSQICQMLNIKPKKFDSLLKKILNKFRKAIQNNKKFGEM